MADLVQVKEWAWAETEAREAFERLPAEVQAAFEDTVRQRVGERLPVGNHREEVWIERRAYTVWTFLDTDGTLWVTRPPTREV